MKGIAASALCLLVPLLYMLAASGGAKAQARYAVLVGQDGGDFVGTTNEVIQRAVDRAARQGGGVVFIKRGTYVMRDQVRLASGVTLRGEGIATVLRKCDGCKTALVRDANSGDTRITVEDASGFAAGMGVTIGDKSNRSGWALAVRSITAIDGTCFTLDDPLERDYKADNGSFVQNTFPLLAAYAQERVRIESIALDGNAEANERLDGCRGGCINLYACTNCYVVDCIARNYNGDGISFQRGKAITVERCEAYGNRGFGLHPGTGVTHCIMRANTIHHNVRVGLFFCYNVQFSVAADNVIYDNDGYGISIGHQDTHNIISSNSIVGNGSHGIYFRKETEENAAHYNTITGNVICDNGRNEPASGIYIDGVTKHILITGNTITDTRPEKKTQRYAVTIGQNADRVTVSGNDLSANVDGAVQNLAPDAENSIAGNTT